MADDLQRVGLVFKADGAAEFERSLKQVNSSVQENRSSFKLAQSQWDDNTKSVDKLKDRQKYLADQTKDYSDKVKILKGELKELEEAENRDEQAISKKRNQLNTAETSLNNYKKGLEEVNEELANGKALLKEYGENLQETGDKISGVGKKMTIGLTTPIVGLGAAGVKAAMELDEGYDTIITKTGATGDALEELNGIADNLFASMPIEMEDAGTAVGEVNTRFGVTGEKLESLSKTFIQFAEINGTDLNDSIGKVNKVMKQYQIDLSETGNVLGLVTEKGQETGISTDALLDSLQKNGAVFKEMGLNVVQSTNLLAQFEDNGVNAETAVAGLRKSLKVYTDEGKSVDEALSLTISSIKNASTETEALSIAQKTFGTKGAAEMATAIREGRINLDDLSTSMTEYGTTVEDTFEATLDPWDQATTAVNNLKLAGSELGSTLLETLAPILERVAELVKQFSEWFRGLDDDQKKTIVTIGMVVAAIGPLLVVFGTVISSIGKITEGLGAIGGGISWLGKLIIGHPVLAVITLIIGAVILLYNKCEWFRDGVNTIFGKIGGALETLSENTKENLSRMEDAYEENGGGIKGFIAAWWEGLDGLTGGKLGEAVDTVRSKLEDIKNAFFEKMGLSKDEVEAAVKSIKGFFDFKWKLPELKMPHFNIKGGFSLSPLSVPSIGVKWYAKGGILNSPTIFGQGADGNLLGGGEAGKEAVLPIDLLRKYIAEENAKSNATLVASIKEAFEGIAIYNDNSVSIGDRKFYDIVSDNVTKRIDRKEKDKFGLRGSFT